VFGAPFVRSVSFQFDLLVLRNGSVIKSCKPKQK
jgi:hypothetical protein